MERTCFSCESPFWGSAEQEGCSNIRCEYNVCDKCPVRNCEKIGCLVGDEALLYECENKHFWSYHVCQDRQDGKDGRRQFGEPGQRRVLGKFIGYLNHDDYSDPRDINIYDDSRAEHHENNPKFVKCPPKNIPFEDLQLFVWKCPRCKQKYINILSG